MASIARLKTSHVVRLDGLLVRLTKMKWKKRKEKTPKRPENGSGSTKQTKANLQN